MNVPSCPNCGSPKTQSIKLLCLSMTNSGTSLGAGVTSLGSIGAGIATTSSMSSLAQGLVPGPKPVGWPSYILAGIITVFLALFSLHAGPLVFIRYGFSPLRLVIEPEFYYGVVFTLIFVGAVLMGVITAKQQPAWLEKETMHEHGWICLQCGHKWVLEQSLPFGKVMN
jgi:hypothetical protein